MNGTYYFDNGRGGLTERRVLIISPGTLAALGDDGKPSEVDKDGKPVPFVTGAKTPPAVKGSDSKDVPGPPVDGSYVADTEEKKPEKK